MTASKQKRRVGRDPERVRAARTRWKLRNPERVRADNRLRHQRVSTWLRQEKAARGCAVCGTHENLEWDHITPRYYTGRRTVTQEAGTWAAARRILADPDIQVLCSEHHIEKSKADGLYGRPKMEAA